MLKRLCIDNFKCLDGFELKLDGHALLMGANGSGKSTVIEGSSNMSACANPRLQLIVASHHPEIIDLMARDYGYVFERDDALSPVKVRRFVVPESSSLRASELVARGEV